MEKPRVEVSNPFCGILRMQLCAVKDATDQELLDVANRDNPSGTQFGWVDVVHKGKYGPVPCADDPLTRAHFLVRC